MNNTTFRNPGRPLRKVSDKRMEENKQYVKLRSTFLEKHPRCQIKSCGKRAVYIHHVAGRYGKNFLNVAKFLAVCFQHHDEIHCNARLARARGLLV